MPIFVDDEPGLRPAVTTEALQQHMARADGAYAIQQKQHQIEWIGLAGLLLAVMAVAFINRRKIAGKTDYILVEGGAAIVRIARAAKRYGKRIVARADER